MPSSSQVSGLDFNESESVVDWVRSHGRALGIGAIAAVALVAVMWVVRAQNESNEISAARQLVGAQRSVGAGNLPLAAADLKKLADRFGSTRAGADAKILLAQVLLQQGKTAEAVKVLDGVSTGGTHGASVYALRAAALEQTGKAAEAAAAYLQAAGATVLKAEAESFKADAARAYLASGRKADALKIWQEMAANPASALYNEAMLRVGELTAEVQK